MIYLKYFEDYKFSDFFGKNKWEKLSLIHRKELKKELWELVDLAYKPLGGHVRINNPDSVLNDLDLDFWVSIDVDQDPYSDVVIFSRKSYGNKISGWGHDGSKVARKALVDKLISLLKEREFWIEVSGKPAELLISSGCNVLTDKKSIEKIFNSEITLLDDNGLYKRRLPDGNFTEPEYVIGYPNI